MKIFDNNIWKISSYIQNNNYNFNKKEILNNLPEKFIDEAINSISSWNTYSPTPLLKLNKLNEHLNFGEIYYKDENKRFDLKSFKALGGAFAVNKIANEKKKPNYFNCHCWKSWPICCMGISKTWFKM